MLGFYLVNSRCLNYQAFCICNVLYMRHLQNYFGKSWTDEKCLLGDLLLVPGGSKVANSNGSASIAQSVARESHNLKVVSSILTRGMIILC